MCPFKVGDIVRVTKADPYQGSVHSYMLGHLYRVTSVNEVPLQGHTIDTVGITEPRAKNGWSARFFELAKPKRNLPDWF
jgi:hypothetical protein